MVILTAKVFTSKDTFLAQALEEAITEQHEQERSIENEIEAYRKDIVREQIRNEQLTAIMTKLEGESGFLQTQNESMVKKQEKLQVDKLHQFHAKILQILPWSWRTTNTSCHCT